MTKITKLFSKLLNLDFYVSPLDNFLNEYNHSHKELSKSQRKEVNKYARVMELRDNPQAKDTTKANFWDKF